MDAASCRGQSTGESKSISRWPEGRADQQDARGAEGQGLLMTQVSGTFPALYDRVKKGGGGKKSSTPKTPKK